MWYLPAASQTASNFKHEIIVIYEGMRFFLFISNMVMKKVVIARPGLKK